MIKFIDPKPQVRKFMDTAKETLDHYKAGFQLLFYDIKISSALTWKLLKGCALTRRERRQLVRTTGDLLRLVPFSIFIIVPFMEFLLPVALKLFPNMLPSTFDSEKDKEERRKKRLKVKLEMAKVLQDSVEEIASVNPNKIVESDLKVKEMWEKLRTGTFYISQEEVIKFLKLFEDELTLDNLSRKQVVALCRTIGLPTVGTTNFLAFQLRIRMRQLRADDLMILKEGVDSMTVSELQTACQDRGMRAIGITIERLRSQMRQWLNLNIKEKVPTTILLLSRALMINPSIDPDTIKSSLLTNLSENLVHETDLQKKRSRGENIANRERLEVIREEDKRIAEEREEENEESGTEEKKPEEHESIKENETKTSTPTSDSDKKKILKEEGKEKPVISQEELHSIADAVANLSSCSSLQNELEELNELRGEREEYKESKNGVEESFSKRQLEKKLDKVIKKLEEEIHSRDALSVATIDADKDGVVSLDELINAAKARNIPLEESRLAIIAKCLDIDNDGKLVLKEIHDVFEALEKEETNISIEDIKRVAALLAAESKTKKP
ncbi:mitochondrial proton/calcium exchanger protein-like [Zophobas morio]|uniref:mitochondrial proton/calcium exchanger protein-like n=1 Tax=Zophobas morio TaxID=2755281 RepID=UPI00308322C6